MRTLINDPFEDDAISILAWAYGPKAKRLFVQFMAAEVQRAGQAFMNTLRMIDPAEYIRISQSPADPFYKDTLIPAAIEMLTTK